MESHTVEEAECAVGVLIDIDQTEVITEKPTEVCLVEEGGEELDLIVWEEIKEGENVRAFRICTDLNPERSKSRGVQTEPMLGFETSIVCSKRYHLLDDRMLQDPFDPKELSFVNNKPSNVGFYDEPPTLFPAFTTSAPLRPMTDREKFGPAPY